MRNVWRVQKQFYRPDEQALTRATEYAICRSEDKKFSDVLARTIAEDIVRERSYMTYYLDGQPVDGHHERLFAVGHSGDALIISRETVETPEDVHAVLELLREEIDVLREGVDDFPVCIGFVCEEKDVLFDVANVVEGNSKAAGLADYRHQKTFCQFGTGLVADTDANLSRPCSSWEAERMAKGWITFARRQREEKAGLKATMEEDEG